MTPRTLTDADLGNVRGGTSEPTVNRMKTSDKAAQAFDGYIRS